MLNHHHSFGANNQPQQSLPQQSLSIDQFLRAAKLLEKHALEKLIIGQQQQHQTEDPMAKLFDAGGHAFTRPLLAKLGGKPGIFRIFPIFLRNEGGFS